MVWLMAGSVWVLVGLAAAMVVGKIIAAIDRQELKPKGWRDEDRWMR
jgi:hypothetical protein